MRNLSVYSTNVSSEMRSCGPMAELGEACERTTACRFACFVARAA